MFCYVKGELVTVEAGTAVVDCGGVGYQCTVSLQTAEAVGRKIGETVMLYTHLAVREDGVELFGFGSKEELSAFKLLNTVSGVGPKAAISILSLLTPERFAYAVCTEDVKLLAKASGIGAKTAARIVLELKDKLAKAGIGGSSVPASDAKAFTAPVPQGKLSEATDALTVLGYNRAEITEVLRTLDIANMPLEAIITAALKKFAN